MIIVKPSKDILQLNKGFRFERNSTAFDELGNLYFPHNARFAQGKFGKALLVEEGTTNLYPNPIVGPVLTECFAGQGWGHAKQFLKSDGLFGSTITRTHRVSLDDMRDISSSESFEWVYPTNQSFCFSVYSRFFGETLGSHQAILRIYFNYYDGTNKVFKGPAFSLTNSWKRQQWAVKTGKETESVYVYFLLNCRSEYTLNDCSDVCAPQIELKDYATTFIDGTRSPEIVTIPISTISPTGGQWDHYAYINSMARRQVAGQTPTLFHIPRQDGGMGIRVCHAEDTANWKLQTMDDTNDITEVDAPDTLTPDGWHRFTVKWTEAEAKLLIDGVVAGTIANPALPSVFAQDAYVGSYDGSKDFLNTLHDDIRVSNIARADADDLTDYQADQPLPTDANTIYKQSFDSPNDMYVRQGLVL